MKCRKLLLALSSISFLLQCASAQTLQSRPRRVSEVAYNAVVSEPATPAASSATREGELESFVPRVGLVYYVEIRSAGLAAMARSGALATLAKSFLGTSQKGALNIRPETLASLPALANTTIGLAGYRSGRLMAFFETASESDAAQLKGVLEPVKSAVWLRGRTVCASLGTAGSAAENSEGGAVIGEDPEFSGAYQRFAGEQFFAFFSTGPLLGLPANNDPAYTPAMMAGLASMPSAVAAAGSIEGDRFVVRALTLGGSTGKPAGIAGLFSSIFSSQSPGQPIAASFVPGDTDVFIDVMLDWDRLYDSISGVFGMVAGSMNGGGSPAGAQSMDFLGAIESKLGFSIKNDLIPTLGNELAISISGFDKMFMGPAARPAGARGAAAPTTPQSPHFLFMASVKDPARFEKLIARVFEADGMSATPPVRTPYRNAVIVHTKSVAYTVANGFFAISGSTADIRRVLDAPQSGSSLASNEEFRGAIPDASKAVMHLYVSPGTTARVIDMLVKDSNLKAELRATASSPGSNGIGLLMTPEGDHSMFELRAPSSLVFKMISALASAKPGGVSIMRGVPGIGIPDSSGPGSAPVRKSPTLTNDDVVRRP